MPDSNPAPNPARAYWDEFVFGWFSAESLGYLRLYFGYALPVYFLIQFVQLFTLDPFGAQFHYTIPIWYFARLGIDHHVPWVDWIVFAGLVAACILFARGRHTRPAILAIILAVAYLKGVRDSFSGDVHHREQPVIALLVLFFLSRCGEVVSADAKRRPSGRPIADWEGSWPIRAMQIYIALFYFWALMAKLRLSGLDWFTGGGRIQDVLIIRALRDGVDASGTPHNLSLSLDLAQQPMLCFAIGVIVFGFELLAPLILFIRRLDLRILFVVAATLFHLSNYLFMNVQFFFYPFVLMAFFDMKAVHQWLFARRRNAKPAQVATG